MSAKALFRLVIADSEREIPHVLGGPEVLVGSGAGCDVRLGHPAVSRRHARLWLAGESCELEDLGSSNGTFLDGRRVKGRVQVETPTTLGFGPVVGRLVRLDPDDGEAAVLLDADAAPPTPADPSRTATTIHSAAIQRLVTEMLPRWIDGLESKLELSALAQRVGGSLQQTLPTRSIDIHRLRGRGPAGVIYRWAAAGTATDVADGAEASEADGLSALPADDPAAVTVDGRHVRCRVLFPHQLQAKAYRPVIESAVRLIDLGAPAPSAPPAGSPAPAALPEPATVVPEVQRIYADAAKVAAGEISVLITGESGTGKEVLARYLHRGSARRGGPFVALNCAALPKDLLESELFGIEEGVATGVQSRPGCFERASGGTLFLDEIGDMAPETQASILRVLQEGEVFRIGGRTARPAAVRVLAATNRDIDALLETREFRTDLYHRIADWRVELPPLRHRRADIVNLAAHFLVTSAGKRGLAPLGISKRATAALEAFDWPGNVRQLEREIARAALFLESGELLQSHHLQPSILEGPASRGLAAGTLRDRLELAERRILEKELRLHGGDVRAVAATLQIGRSTLYRRIRDWGLEVDDV